MKSIGKAFSLTGVHLPYSYAGLAPFLFHISGLDIAGASPYYNDGLERHKLKSSEAMKCEKEGLSFFRNLYF